MFKMSLDLGYFLKYEVVLAIDRIDSIIILTASREL